MGNAIDLCPFKQSKGLFCMKIVATVGPFTLAGPASLWPPPRFTESEIIPAPRRDRMQ